MDPVRVNYILQAATYYQFIYALKRNEIMVYRRYFFLVGCKNSVRHCDFTQYLYTVMINVYSL